MKKNAEEGYLVGVLATISHWEPRGNHVEVIDCFNLMKFSSPMHFIEGPSCLEDIVFGHSCIKSFVKEVKHFKEVKRGAGQGKFVEAINLGEEDQIHILIQIQIQIQIHIYTNTYTNTNTNTDTNI